MMFLENVLFIAVSQVMESDLHNKHLHEHLNYSICIMFLENVLFTGGSQVMESSLHKHLHEHLNAEIILGKLKFFESFCGSGPLFSTHKR
jgi:hypothetical protein